LVKLLQYIHGAMTVDADQTFGVSSGTTRNSGNVVGREVGELIGQRVRERLLTSLDSEPSSPTVTTCDPELRNVVIALVDAELKKLLSSGEAGGREGLYQRLARQSCMLEKLNQDVPVLRDQLEASKAESAALRTENATLWAEVSELRKQLSERRHEAATEVDSWSCAEPWWGEKEVRFLKQRYEGLEAEVAKGKADSKAKDASLHWTKTQVRLVARELRRQKQNSSAEGEKSPRANDVVSMGQNAPPEQAPFMAIAGQNGTLSTYATDGWASSSQAKRNSQSVGGVTLQMGGTQRSTKPRSSLSTTGSSSTAQRQAPDENFGVTRAPMENRRRPQLKASGARKICGEQSPGVILPVGIAGLEPVSMLHSTSGRERKTFY